MTRKVMAISALAVGVFVIGVAACASDSRSTTDSEPLAAGASAAFAVAASSATTTTVPATDAGPPPTGFFGAPAAACESDMHILQTAIEAYVALNGDVEMTEQDLVDAGLLREQSQLYDIGPGHTVVAGPGSGCAG